MVVQMNKNCCFDLTKIFKFSDMIVWYAFVMFENDSGTD